MAAGTFPAVISTSAAQASAKLGNNALNALQTNATPLDRLTFLEEVVSNLLTDLPSGINLPATFQAGGVAGGVLTTAQTIKRVTAIADATATSVLTITVPNVTAAASVRVTLNGALGAGGAVGAGEANGTVSYDFVIGRFAGNVATILIATAYGSAMTLSAGAATVTVTAAASTVTGGATASNSFTVNVTITKGSGSSANHTCVVWGTVLNSLAGGVTIA